jgi:hypothetical protein
VDDLGDSLRRAPEKVVGPTWGEQVGGPPLSCGSGKHLRIEENVGDRGKTVRQRSQESGSQTPPIGVEGRELEVVDEEPACRESLGDDLRQSLTKGGGKGGQDADGREGGADGGDVDRNGFEDGCFGSGKTAKQRREDPVGAAEAGHGPLVHRG